MFFTKSIFDQFWRSCCKKSILIIFQWLKFLPKSQNSKIAVAAMSQVTVLTKQNRYWTDTSRCSEVSLKTAYEGFRFVAEVAIWETWGRLGLGLGSVRRGAMREKRKSEKIIFETTYLVILNSGLLLWIQVRYSVLVKGKGWMGMGGNSETDGARPPPWMEPEQYKKCIFRIQPIHLWLRTKAKTHKTCFSVIFEPP